MMTHTPDEIKKGLERLKFIANAGLIDDALALIQQLEAQNAELLKKVEQLQAERDSALADINKNCYTCGVSAETLHEEPCNSCRRSGGNIENWQWRGVQKEE